jgi:hypothetical protein
LGGKGVDKSFFKTGLPSADFVPINPSIDYKYSALRCDKTQKVIGKFREAALSNNFLYYSKPQ